MYTTRSIRWILLTFVLALGACAGGTGNEPGDQNRDTYPEGPYGNAEGDILDNHSFETADGAAFDFDADIFKDEGAKLMLLSTAAGWCTSCIEEQSSLQALHEEHAADGLRVVVTLFEDQNFEAADDVLASEWIDTHDIEFDVVVDAPFVMEDYYDATLTPMLMFVDVNTMEILSITTGWDESLVDALIDASL